MKLTKHKNAKVIVIDWSSALDTASALNLVSFQLSTVPRNKKQHPKPIAVSRVIYQPGSSALTIVTAKPLKLSSPVQLIINAASLLNASGNPIESSTPGQPGSNVVILVTQSGVIIQSQ